MFRSVRLIVICVAEHSGDKVDSILIINSTSLITDEKEVFNLSMGRNHFSILMWKNQSTLKNAVNTTSEWRSSPKFTNMFTLETIDAFPGGSITVGDFLCLGKVGSLFCQDSAPVSAHSDQGQTAV
jgi:hypothetical protein